MSDLDLAPIKKRWANVASYNPHANLVAVRDIPLLVAEVERLTAKIAAVEALTQCQPAASDPDWRVEIVEIRKALATGDQR